jgi:hypothetical protein
MKFPSFLVLPLALSACASAPSTDPGKADAGTRIGQAATAPLNDLNLVRTEIPPVLVSAQKAPYASPEPSDCASLARQIEALDAALGPDLDKPPAGSEASLRDKSTDAVDDAAFDALRSTAEGVVPFRGWVRKLTGAESYAKSVTAALVAGNIRRAYLKGLGQARGCPEPARPRVAAEPAKAASAP